SAPNSFGTIDVGGLHVQTIIKDKEIVFEMFRANFPLFFDKAFLFEDSKSYKRIGPLLRANKRMAYEAMFATSGFFSSDEIEIIRSEIFKNIAHELNWTPKSSTKNTLVSPEDIKADAFLVETALSKGYGR